MAGTRAERTTASSLMPTLVRPGRATVPHPVQKLGMGTERGVPTHIFPAAGGKMLQLSAGSAVTPVEIKENLRCGGELSRSL